jgi:hypothetical protein
MIFAGLLTVVAYAHPFAGTVKVGPEALAAVVRDFAGVPPWRTQAAGWGSYGCPASLKSLSNRLAAILFGPKTLEASRASRCKAVLD